MIYLDSASTTQIDPDVLDAMMPYLKDEYGNPGTLYGLGRRAREAVENARVQVANMIGAEPDQVIFTSGGTESNNTVWSGFEDIIPHGSARIITSSIEHHSILQRAINADLEDRAKVSFVEPDGIGRITADAFNESTSMSGTSFASIMHTNNETGVENEICRIGELCRENGITFHTDCVQAAGTKKLDVNELNCDFMSLSSHKIHGPKGVGALYIRDRVIHPMICGGVNQEFGLRGGTENVAGIVGFGKACEIVTDHIDEIVQKIDQMYEVFYWRLAEIMASKGLSDRFHVNGVPFDGHGKKTINLRFDGIDGETLVFYLDHKGVCVSAGAACTSGEQKPSHVLTAMGISEEDARNSIRVSFSRMNNLDEVKIATHIIADAVCTLSKGVM